MGISTKEFGKTKSGEVVTLYSLTNKNGMKAEFINFGAILVNLFVKDKNGNFDDVVLGYDNLKSYEEGNGPGFGSFIGRHANRIEDAKFTLGTTTYELEKNDNNNNLHGGAPGYNKVMYQAETKTEKGMDSVTFSRVSPDMEQGFPGNLNVSVTYFLTDEDELGITYQAKSDKDTLVNLTNHSYFNLAGHKSGSILDHKVILKAKQFTPTAQGLIPKGEFMNVAGTPMDFNELKRIGDDIDRDFKAIITAGGYDHNYVIDREDDGKVIYEGELVEETTGRKMEIYSDLVGMQFYTGNFIMGEKGKDGAYYTKRDGVCFETQFFPNSMNVPEFKSCELKAGETFESTTIYAFKTL